MIRQFEGTSHVIIKYSNEKQDEKLNISAVWIDDNYENKEKIKIRKTNTMMDLRKTIADIYDLKPCDFDIIVMKGGRQIPMSHIELRSKVLVYKNISNAYL